MDTAHPHISMETEMKKRGCTNNADTALRDGEGEMKLSTPLPLW
jgi:hypothetical protein